MIHRRLSFEDRDFQLRSEFLNSDRKSADRGLYQIRGLRREQPSRNSNALDNTSVRPI